MRNQLYYEVIFHLIIYSLQGNNNKEEWVVTNIKSNKSSTVRIIQY